MKFSLIIFIIGSFTIEGYSQEICDNAIDDDGDSLVDLNDDDCICETTIPTSLLPNPSFEEMTCCPMENERLDCAVGWIQASAPTTDYVHTCGGYLGNIRIPAVAPLPFPDGNGGVGFRDGVQGEPNYKEYVGGCLTKPMEVEVFYRFDFFVGFQDDRFGSTEFRIAVFATTDCNELPFGNGSATIGCPANTGKYTELGEVLVRGSNEWVNVVFEFEADQPYSAIVLGPSCSANPNAGRNPYFYLDRLTLAESSEFGIPFESISGAICDNNLVLQAQEVRGATYQWYRNGIAMIGETNSSLLLEALNDTEGKYLAVTTDDDKCVQSQEYILRIPPYYAPINETICENELYLFGSETLNTQGNYERTLRATDGCDSIIQLSLTVDLITEATVQDTFCEGDIYSYLDIIATDPGLYGTTIINSAGCDSIITLDLYQVALPEPIEMQDTLIINLGESATFQPIYYDPRFTSFIWSDSEGNIVGVNAELSLFLPTKSGIFLLKAFDNYGCSSEKEIKLIVNSNYVIYAPNIFSPDENGINDYFQIYAPPSVEMISSLVIFDRWGNLVFKDQNIDYVDGYEGWDGTYNSIYVPIGVYTYLVEVLFIDGVQKTISGSVTVIR